MTSYFFFLSRLVSLSLNFAVLVKIMQRIITLSLPKTLILVFKGRLLVNISETVTLSYPRFPFLIFEGRPFIIFLYN